MKTNYKLQISRYYLLLASCFLFLFFSCGQEEKHIVIPSDVLPKEKIAQVITDIHIAEAEATLNTLPDSASTERVSFQKIFVKCQITKQQYEKSLSFYIDHPELLNEIYEQALNELSKMQARNSKR